MEFRVLGPVEIRVAGQLADAGHAKQRAVLAVLLLDLGRVVPAELLIDRVWGEEPPGSGRNVLYGYLARLRAIIAGADPEARLARRQGGYVLQAGAEQLDLGRFRRLVAEVAAAGDDEHAEALLREALGLWRGPPLGGLDSPWLRRMRDALEMERVAAVLDLNDIRLRQGQHGALVSELAGQAATYPGDERLIGQLMLALYRSGRQAEALRWFEQTRQHLAGELGTDPGSGLQSLHQQILRGDLPMAGPGPGRRPAGPVPHQLPADVQGFTGRAAELAELDRLLPRSAAGAAATSQAAWMTRQGQATAAVISAIGGTAGVGKTALALHWAHLAAARFPDGQLYVNLRGYDPDQPVAPTDVLAGFLRALGVGGQEIPPGKDERAARYRSLLAGRRMLIILDNASEVEQVRPLLPGTQECATVVTSRDALAGLVAREGAARLQLDLLPLTDAVGLLRALIGARADADPAAAQELAERCCRLPLALRVAAELATAHPDRPLAELAAELADQRRHLDLLDAGGDPRTAVRAVFSWSYRHLDAAAADAFRLAGLHPGPDLDPYAVAALTGTSLEQADRVLEVLARAHLVQPTVPDRHGMHDLLRAYARDLAAHLGEDEQRAALTRLFDHYLHTAAAAMDTLLPAERHVRPRIPQPSTPVPPLTHAGAARAWLDAERAGLVAVAAYAAEHGWPGHAIRLAATVLRYLQDGCYFPEAVSVHSHAGRAARLTGNRAAEATALASLGLVGWRQGRYQEAADHCEQAVALFRDVGDHGGQARALHNHGLIDFEQGSYEQAAGHFRQALALYRETGEQIGQAVALTGLGRTDEQQGRYQQAAGHFRQAHAIYRQAGHPTGEAITLGSLGLLAEHQGRYEEAADHHRQALALFRQTGDRTNEAYGLGHLGVIDQRQGRCQQAADHQRQALALFRQTGDQSGEAEALNGLGEALLGDGRPGDARTQHATALRLASDIGHKYELARAHNGLGHAHDAVGEPAEARQHWQQALARYTELGCPEADQVRAQLTATHDKT